MTDLLKPETDQSLKQKQNLQFRMSTVSEM